MKESQTTQSPAGQVRLSQDFFQRSHLIAARELVGCTLHWGRTAGIVVETEAYAAQGDPACHTSFRPSARRFFEENPPGTAYVYLNYGIYWLLNVLTADGIVLIRAMEPLRGIRLMQTRRARTALADLCSGPGKLGQALNLSAEDHGRSLLSTRQFFQSRPTDFSASLVVEDIRVGLSKAKERPWRFLWKGHNCVSVGYGRVKP